MEPVIEPLIEPFAERWAELLLPEVWQWIRPDELRQRLGRELGELWTERRQPDWCAGYAESIAISGPDPAEYAVRHLDLGPLGPVLAGIHFLGMDPGHPFIGVHGLARDYSADQLERLACALGGEFAAFRPRSIRLFIPGPAGRLAAHLPPSASHDNRLIVGLRSALRVSPRPPGFERIELRPLGDDAYPRYRATCEQFFADTPDGQRMLEIESEDDLRACQTCFEAWIDDTWAGLVAARHEDIFGLSGHCVVEEILTRPFRGFGLGIALQRHLIERLEPHGHDLIWGTIDARNLPSRKTAERVGRTDIGGWIFIPVAT
ncbi:MAG: GNAT family N-acetyltransferase [Myxococcota bacterium]